MLFWQKKAHQKQNLLRTVTLAKKKKTAQKVISVAFCLLAELEETPEGKLPFVFVFLIQGLCPGSGRALVVKIQGMSKSQSA